MDHNDKRSHSVPAGTFADHSKVIPPASQSQVHEDTVPRFTLDPRPQRQRVRTLLGVPPLGAEGSEKAWNAGQSQNSRSKLAEHDIQTDGPDGSDVAYASDETYETLIEAPDFVDEPALSPDEISIAIAEVLEVLDEPTSKVAAVPPPAPLTAAQTSHTGVSESRAERAELVGAEDDVERLSRLSQFTLIEDEDDEEVSARLSSLPSVSVPETTTDSMIGLPPALPGSAAARAVPPAVIDVAPPSSDRERGALGEPVALQAVASLDELGAEITQRVNRQQVQEAGLSDVLAANRNRASSPPPLLTSPLSSLAPREVSRAQVEQAVRSEERGSGWGALAVAAVMLLATGAWWITSGTFQRTYGAQTPASQPVEPSAQTAVAVPQKAAVAEELASRDEGMAKPAPLAAAEPEPTEAPTAAPVIEPQPSHAKPARASKSSLTATRRDSRAYAPRAKAGLVLPEQTVPTEQPTLPSDLPDAPTRGEVVQRLESVRSSVRACAAGRSGVADLDITIAHTGNVTHVLVGGDFAGTTEGSCIARAVRGARFSSFKQERFRLLFPYAI